MVQVTEAGVSPSFNVYHLSEQLFSQLSGGMSPDLGRRKNIAPSTSSDNAVAGFQLEAALRRGLERLHFEEIP